jgi:hypothetical protein
MAMPTLYESLIRLYPSSYRREFADEMLSVFCSASHDARQKGIAAATRFYVRETGGLIRGIVTEHVRRLFGGHISFPISSRRFAMHSQFRFPKSTAVLMVVILAGVLLAIEKAKAIVATFLSMESPNSVTPLQHLNIVSVLAMLFALFYAAGIIGWAVLFALRRSGMHRLSDISGVEGGKANSIFGN